MEHYKKLPEYKKPDYLMYIEYLELLGWRRNHSILTEKDTYIVTTNSCDIGTTGYVVDVRCPPGKKISIIGSQQLPEMRDPRISPGLGTLGIQLCSKCGVEISPFTKIRITKETCG